ncbi:e07bed38-2ed0-4768-ab05-24163b5f7a47 [Thermothielavioides terrestris]|uniref:E07bed38-2ed0-4768-ab05-24163b5f7a47 n=1 Tax=Thermothielavioides terrestris TaxID=2587410 RepID=A0A3S4B6Q8_9PEZI|nr:e07bed38-2ed0-4768-ab05-24163b5f7a47 [Thermothielavioides terrestris]
MPPLPSCSTHRRSGNAARLLMNLLLLGR